MGDPSGIGPAITLGAVNKLKGLADVIVIGDAWVLAKAQSSKLKTQSCRLIDLNNVNRKKFNFGEIKAEYGRASIEYLDKAIELLDSDKADCLVTCPISKEAINKAGFLYSGHTEYLADCTGIKEPVMMLLNEDLKFSLVTRHVPLKEVSSQLSRDKIQRVVLATYHALERLFGIEEPRMVVCGLNPHASDNGVIGREEVRLVRPAIEALRKKIKNLDGPISADVAIARARAKIYDAVIAMYHDQALIPLKMLGGHTGVNLTLGLRFVRTSPLHGTAFDIAQNPKLANPDSLIQAIKLAVKCALNLKKT
jgi:4-hydroxythreonine-4-phosphate dehydrogenase